MATDVVLAHRSSLDSLLASPVIFVKGLSNDTFGMKLKLPAAAMTESVQKTATKNAGAGLAEPTKQLFDDSVLQQSWAKVLPAPPGLHNMGNTCYLNSTMQCLMHVPSLVQYLLSSAHSEACRLNHCVLCRLEDHAQRVFPAQGTKRGQAFTPRMAKPASLKQLGKHFRPGRQEDAHEFLVLLLEQLQVACLQGQPKTLDHRSKETTLVHGIFGGHLRQQIVCQKCRNPSNTYEALLALSVDVCNTIDQSLARITSSEMLVGKNRYRCAHCKSLQDARKQTTLYRAPQTLIVHLKRFHFAARSSKISKHVQIPERLDVSKYMAPGRTALPYTLTGVVVHDGGGVSSGHYYAFGKQSNGVWAEYNDSSVSQVSLGRVLKQQAYMLFYTQDEGETLKGASNKSTSSEIPLKQSTTSPVSQMVPLKKRKAEELTVTNGSSDVLAMLDRDASSHKPRTHLRNGVGAVSREAREHGSGSWSKKRSHEQRHTGHNKKRIITSMRRV